MILIQVVVVIVIFGALVAILLQRASDKSRPYWLVFVAYLLAIPVFGATYYAMYRTNYGRFAFADGVAAQRRLEAVTSARARLAVVRDRVAMLKDAIVLLRQQSAPLQFQQVGYWDIAEVNTSGRAFDIEMGFMWRIADDQHVWCENYVARYDAARTSLHPLREPFLLHGPNFDDPKKDEKITQILQERRPEYFASLISARLQQRLAEQQQLEATIASGATSRWNFLDFTYFSAITQTTVGYGDIVPNSTSVRCVVTLQVVLGVVLLSIAVAILAVRNSG